MRLSNDPISKGALNVPSGNPLWDGKGEGGLEQNVYILNIN